MCIRDSSTTEGEGAVDSRADDDRGVNGRLEADTDAGEDHRGRAGERGARDVVGRAGLGAGEVTGEPEDDAREDDAQEHGQGGACLLYTSRCV